MMYIHRCGPGAQDWIVVPIGLEPPIRLTDWRWASFGAYLFGVDRCSGGFDIEYVLNSAEDFLGLALLMIMMMPYSHHCDRSASPTAEGVPFLRLTRNPNPILDTRASSRCREACIPDQSRTNDHAQLVSWRPLCQHLFTLGHSVDTGPTLTATLARTARSVWRTRDIEG
jgi:hypothetical protein